MKTKTILRLLPALAAGLVLTVSASLAQTVLIQDTFTLTDTRVAGSLLNGTSPESGYLGDEQWNVTVGANNTVFSSGGTIVASTNNATNEARIDIGSATGIMTVSASLVTNTSNWVGIGFTSDDSTGTFTTAGVGLLWVTINPSGTVTVYVNGTSQVQSKTWATAFQSTLGAYDSTVAYTVSLSYNTATNKAYVTISNGSATASLVTGGGTSPDGWFPVSVTASAITAAGFRINGQSGTTAGAASVDDFVVTTTTAIPEPSSVAAIMGMAAFAGLVLFRRVGRAARV